MTGTVALLEAGHALVDGDDILRALVGQGPAVVQERVLRVLRFAVSERVYVDGPIDEDDVVLTLAVEVQFRRREIAAILREVGETDGHQTDKR